MIREDDIVEVDDDFLSLVEEAEANALSVKRRNIITIEDSTFPSKKKKLLQEEEEGLYTSVLKGNSTVLDSLNIKTTGKVNLIANNNFSSHSGGGGTSDNGCFKCGQLGHWSRDCTASGLGLQKGNGNDGVPEKPCSCGLGTCLVLTANTERNRGRKFYKCPMREENGGCGFFEWCDNSGTTPMSGGVQFSASNSSFPDLPCPCGAGPSLVLTAKTGQNVGQQFYRCPAKSGSCGFFKWCNEQTSNSSNTTNKSYAVTSGSPCFKCGKNGHWARDCPDPPSFPSSPGIGGSGSASSGTIHSRTNNLNNTNNNNYGGGGSNGSTCFKCGQDGHWAKDCSANSSGPSSVGKGGSSASSNSCFKCGNSGHWSKDCPGQDQKASKGSRNISSSYSSYC